MAKKAVPPDPSPDSVIAVENNNRIGLGQRPLPSLRELGQSRLILDEWLAETEGEETPELAELFQQLEGETHEKVERWGLYLLDRQARAALLKADEDFYRAEAERLAAMRESYEANTERSARQLQMQMEVQGIDRVDGVRCTVMIQLNPPKVLGDVPPETLAEWFLDEEGVLHTFVRYRPEQYELDRNAVKAAAMNALIERLPDGLTIERAKRLVVK